MMMSKKITYTIHSGIVIVIMFFSLAWGSFRPKGISGVVSAAAPYVRTFTRGANTLARASTLEGVLAFKTKDGFCLRWFLGI